MISFTLNGETVSTDVDASTPLLWVVRDAFKLKGSKVWLWRRFVWGLHYAC